MKVAILYICTGNYHIFWPGFSESARRFFLPGMDKHFFVFSDAPAEQFAQPDVTLVYQDKLGWPYDSLYRFKMFLQVENALRKYDYIFFFNANCIFNEHVDSEFLPTIDEGLVVVRHSGYYATDPIDLPYERNPRSLAYIPYGRGSYYIVGGVNGGCSSAYLNLIVDIAWAIEKDENNDIIALWHDESHINKYILTRKHKVLPPSYCFFEGYDIPFRRIIIAVDKNKFGGYSALRGIPKIPPAPFSPPPFKIELWRKIRHLRRKLHLLPDFGKF